MLRNFRPEPLYNLSFVVASAHLPGKTRAAQNTLLQSHRTIYTDRVYTAMYGNWNNVGYQDVPFSLSFIYVTLRENKYTVFSFEFETEKNKVVYTGFVKLAERFFFFRKRSDNHDHKTIIYETYRKNCPLAGLSGRGLWKLLRTIVSIIWWKHLPGEFYNGLEAGYWLRKRLRFNVLSTWAIISKSHSMLNHVCHTCNAGQAWHVIESLAIVFCCAFFSPLTILYQRCREGC